MFFQLKKYAFCLIFYVIPINVKFYKLYSKKNFDRNTTIFLDHEK